jgi:hypothetical protein
VVIDEDQRQQTRSWTTTLIMTRRTAPSATPALASVATTL